MDVDDPDAEVDDPGPADPALGVFEYNFDADDKAVILLIPSRQ